MEAETRRCLNVGFGALALLAVAGVLFIQGCATTVPSAEQIHYYRRYGVILQDEPASLILDGCVIRDQAGADYVLLQATEDISDAARNTAVGILEANGYEVAGSEIPFLCGVIAPGDDGEAVMLEAARYKGDEREEMAFPIVRFEQFSDDDRRLADAYHAMIQQMTTAEPSASRQSHARRGEEAPFTLDSGQAALLRDALGTDFVWIIRVGGVQVSTGKSLGTGFLTGLMSAAISGGTFIYTETAVHGNGYDIALVDLSDISVVWKKKMLVRHGNPASPGIYNGDWAKEAFSPFMHLTLPPPAPKVRAPKMDAEELLNTENAHVLRGEAQALHAHPTSDRAIFDAAAQRIWDERDAEDDVMVDAMAWFCRVLGQSGDGRYKSLLDDVAEKAATRKLRRYAESAKKIMPLDDVEQFRPRRADQENLL